MSRRLNLTAWEIQDRLLHTTPTTPLFPWLPADAPLPAQARRSDGPAPCLIPLVEAVASGLRGDVLEARPRLRDRDGLWIRRRPKRRSRGERVVSLNGHMIAGLRRIDADLGLVTLLEAFACRDTATDLLDAWGDLLAAWQANDRQLDEALAVPLARAADELWHWLRFRDREPVPAYNRLFELVIDVSCEERPDPASEDLAPLLTDPEAFRVYRETGLVAPSRLPEAMTRRVAGATFRGPQLGQLVLAVERGLHAMLVGPRGTGKSLCATEAAQFAHRELLTVEGHESMQPVDLLGGYVPDQVDRAPGGPVGAAGRAGLPAGHRRGGSAGQPAGALRLGGRPADPGHAAGPGAVRGRGQPHAGQDAQRAAGRDLAPGAGADRARRARGARGRRLHGPAGHEPGSRLSGQPDRRRAGGSLPGDAGVRLPGAARRGGAAACTHPRAGGGGGLDGAGGAGDAGVAAHPAAAGRHDAARAYWPGASWCAGRCRGRGMRDGSWRTRR